MNGATEWPTATDAEHLTTLLGHVGAAPPSPGDPSVPDGAPAHADPATARDADLAVADLVDAYARAAWSSLVEPGDSAAFHLIDRLGPVGALVVVERDDPLNEVLDAAGIESVADRQATGRAWKDGLERWRTRLDHEVFARRLGASARLGCVLLRPGDAAWPRAVDDLGAHAPLALWVRGDLGCVPGAPPGTAGTSGTAGTDGASRLHGPTGPIEPDGPRGIAVVGARAATGYGEHVAAELAVGLADRRFTVVSGAAYGIDGVAHRAALTVGGSTVAFLAGGLDRFYPTGHSSLLERIVAEGAVVSELPVGSSPTRWRFLQCNRLIAAISAVTVVVEAGARSGSLNTAGHAAALGRPLGAVPGPVTSASSAGCHRLLREFDAVCVTSAAEAAELAGFEETTLASTPGDRRRQSDTGTTDQRRILDALGPRRSLIVAELAGRAGLSLDATSAALGGLLIAGRVERLDDGRWRAART